MEKLFLRIRQIINFIKKIFRIIVRIFIWILVVIKFLMTILIALGLVFACFYTYTKLSETQTAKAIFSLILGGGFIIGIFYIKKIIQMIRNAYGFFKEIIGWIVFDYKKSKQIIKSNNITFQEFKFLLTPLSTKNYFTLNSLGKELLKESDNKNYNLVKKVDIFLSKNFGKNLVHVTDIENQKQATILTLYKSININFDKFKKINPKDILNNIGFSINKYQLRIELGDNPKIIITKKVNKNTYKNEDYSHNFKKNNIYLGVDDFGKVVKFPIIFKDANHFGVYGKTGGGKSNLTKTIAYNLYNQNKNYDFYILDIKGDFSNFRGIKGINYAHKLKDILNLLGRIENEMNRIKDKFHEHKFENFQDYLDSKNKDFIAKPTFIFIEEFSYLLDEIEEKALKSEVIKIVRNIAKIGRSISYNLVLSLQTPLIQIIGDSEIFRMIRPISFNINNEFSSKIFGKSIKDYNYNLNELGIGEGIFRDKNENVKKFKSFLIEKESLQNLEKSNPKEENICEEYLQEAKQKNSFNKNEALRFGLSRKEFDELSKKLQEEGIIKKMPNNSLEFVENEEEKNENINEE